MAKVMVEATAQVSTETMMVKAMARQQQRHWQRHYWRPLRRKGTAATSAAMVAEVAAAKPQWRGRQLAWQSVDTSCGS
jgi:hypothetical protein